MLTLYFLLTRGYVLSQFFFRYLLLLYIFRAHIVCKPSQRKAKQVLSALNRAMRVGKLFKTHAKELLTEFTRKRKHAKIFKRQQKLFNGDAKQTKRQILLALL